MRISAVSEFPDRVWWFSFIVLTSTPLSSGSASPNLDRIDKICHNFRFISLDLAWLVSLENPSHSQNLFITVHSETSIYGVSRLVKKELGHCVVNVTIHRFVEGGTTVLLGPEKKLTDFGFSGTSPPDPPEEVSLLYDYEYPFLDCPLLMADLQRTRKVKGNDEDAPNREQTGKPGHIRPRPSREESI